MKALGYQRKIFAHSEAVIGKTRVEDRRKHDTSLLLELLVLDIFSGFFRTATGSMDSSVMLAGSRDLRERRIRRRKKKIKEKNE